MAITNALFHFKHPFSFLTNHVLCMIIIKSRQTVRYKVILKNNPSKWLSAKCHRINYRQYRRYQNIELYKKHMWCFFAPIEVEQSLISKRTL